MPTKESIEFVTVSLETCSFLEQCLNHTKKEFAGKLLKILPLLYLKASLLKMPERCYNEEPERFVTEYDYERVKLTVSELLGEHDGFLDCYSPDMQLSEEPLYTTISELLADVYQELKDYVLCCQYNDSEVQDDALAVCLNAFTEHWGGKVLAVCRALHVVYYDGSLDE